MESFLFGDFDASRPGQEIAFAFGAWRHQRLAVGHVDLEEGRLHVTAATQRHLCGFYTSLHACELEPGGFLALHRCSGWEKERYRLTKLPLLQNGLLLARPSSGSIPEPVRIAQGSPTPQSRAPAFNVPSGILSCKLEGIGPCWVWHEAGPFAGHFRVTPAEMFGGRLAPPLLFADYLGAQMLVGDLDGDGYDEIAAPEPQQKSTSLRIRVLGLGDRERFEPSEASEAELPGVLAPSPEEHPLHLFNLGCHQAAFEAFERALSSAEPSAKSRILHRLADCYASLDRLEDAAAAYGEAAAAGSNYDKTDAVLEQVRVLMQLRRWTEARSILERFDVYIPSGLEGEEMRRLQREIDSALEPGTSRPLPLADPHRVPLVENPLVCSLSADRIHFDGEATWSPRVALPLQFRNEKFEVHVDLLPLRGDWQTCSAIALGERPFTSERALARQPERSGWGLVCAAFHSDGSTNQPSRYMTPRGASLGSAEIPQSLKPEGGFRWGMEERTHLTITHLPESQLLQIELANSEGEAVWRSWHATPGMLTAEELLWLQFGVGETSRMNAGHRNAFEVTNLEIRAASMKPAVFRPESGPEHIAVGNGHFAREDWSAALESYERALAELDRERRLGGELEGECRLWRGLALGRGAPGAGEEELRRAFELAPAACVHRIQVGWTGLTEAERGLVARIVEAVVLADGTKTRTAQELLRLLGLQPNLVEGTEGLGETLVFAVGAEVSARLFAALPEVCSYLDDAAEEEQRQASQRASWTCDDSDASSS